LLFVGVSIVFFLFAICALGTPSGGNLSSSGLLFLDHPIEYEIVLVAHTIEKIFEKLSEVANIGFLLKLQAAAVVQVDGKFFWKPLS
jgi:hypothetical protein